MNELDTVIFMLKTHGKSICFGAVIGCVFATVMMFVQKPTWQADMIIGPSERTGVPSLSSFLPKVAADAPALQYFVERIDASHATDFTFLTTVLTSPQIATSFYKQYGGDFGYSSVHDVRKYLANNLTIRSYGLTPFKNITLNHRDKAKAEAMLNHIFMIADQFIRQDKQQKTTRRISYLETQLKTIRNPYHRDAIMALLKEQEQAAMMASIDQYLSATVISKATVGLKPVSPNPLILFPGFMALGAFIGLIINGWRVAKP